MEQERRTARVKVTGRVQGVGFRAWTEARARELELDGSVRNLPDGAVEAAFAGAPEAVERMIAALAQGPRLAAVERVERLEAPVVEGTGFRVAR